VLAPSSVAEAADMLYKAFDFADKYKCIVFILTSAMVSQIMEPVEMPPFKTEFPEKPWKVTGNEGRKPNCINPISDMNMYGPPSNRRHQAMYEKWERDELQVEEYCMDDAETVLIAWGTAARIARGAIDNLRAEGKKVGLYRPITLFPFPFNKIRNFDPNKIKNILVAEVAVPAQTYCDVERALLGRIPLHLFDRSWGEIFTTEEVEAELRKLI
jgi:2-oxoglutarate ferredoxin oxidoreductase subunit alpha